MRSTGKSTSQDINALRNTPLVDSPIDHSGEAVKPSLGSDRIICCHTAKRDFESPAAYRWWLLKQVKRLLPEDQRLQRCMVTPVPGTPVIELWRDPAKNSAHWRYVEHCNRPWSCPCCSARMSNKHRKELTDGLARAKLLRWYPVLVTFTLRHDVADQLDDLVQGLNRARRRMLQQRAWRSLVDEYGLKGQIRGLEITYGDNGWHPHLHVLMFMTVKLSEQQIDGLKRWLYDLWHGALAVEAFDASFLHGVDVRTADSDIADYVAKWGHEPKEQEWGVEHEMAKAASKRAHRDGLTPLQLVAASGGEQEALARLEIITGSVEEDQLKALAAALFREYAEAMNGRHQLEWSKGLRAALALQELPAAELTGEIPQLYPVMSMQPGENYKRVCQFDLHPKLSALAAIGATDDLRALLTAWGIVAVVYDRPPELRAGQPGRADNGIAGGETAISGLESMRDPDVESAQGRRITFEQHRRDQADQLDQESRQLELPGAAARPGPALVYR